MQRLRRVLARDELSRAERFRLEKHRAHFIVARGLLRSILGRYLGTAPERVRFAYSPHGKPYLVRDSHPHSLRFNLSHSHAIALYAVTHGREVGIDLERIRPRLAIEQIAERFFSPGEVATLHTLPPEPRIETFYRWWTRKEAYLKATGTGLALSLGGRDVTIAPGEQAGRGGADEEPNAAAGWLCELFPSPGYAAALAVEGQGRGFSYRQFSVTDCDCHAQHPGASYER